MKLGNLQKLILEGTTGITINGARSLTGLANEYLNLIGSNWTIRLSMF